MNNQLLRMITTANWNQTVLWSSTDRVPRSSYCAAAVDRAAAAAVLRRCRERRRPPASASCSGGCRAGSHT